MKLSAPVKTSQKDPMTDSKKIDDKNDDVFLTTNNAPEMASSNTSKIAEISIKGRPDSSLKDRTNLFGLDNFSTPAIRKPMSFRALLQGKISTPRLEETKSDEKRKCFGFDDDGDEEDDISPVKRTFPAQIFTSPQSPFSGKPQRFNWNLPKQGLNLQSATLPKSVSSASENTEKNSAPRNEGSDLKDHSEKITKDLNCVEKVERKGSEVSQQSDASFTLVKSKKFDSFVEDVPSTVDQNVGAKVPTSGESKAAKNSTKVEKNVCKNSKQVQPLISKFLSKKNHQPKKDEGKTKRFFIILRLKAFKITVSNCYASAFSINFYQYTIFLLISKTSINFSKLLLMKVCGSNC